MFWLLRSLDAGVTETYQDQSRADLELRSEALSAVVDSLLAERDSPWPSEEAASLLRRIDPDGPEPFVKENLGTGPDYIFGAGLALALDSAGHVTRTLSPGDL